MLTFRRAVLVAGCILTLFLLFGGSKTDRLATLENKLRDTERSLESTLRELQQSSDSNTAKFDKAIGNLDAQRKILQYEVRELRKLPDPDASIVEQLSYQYPYSREAPFPAFVWQTWKNDFYDDSIDPSIKQLMEGWRSINVDFVHEVFSDSQAERAIKKWYGNIPKVVEAYTTMPDVILKADFFRYLVLFAMGGVYSDADTEILKPTPNWLPNTLSPEDVGLVVGIEADPDRPDWKDWYARRVQMCQWTIQAKPGHPVLRSVIAKITETTLSRKRNGQLALTATGNDRGGDILEWTGPGIWTDTLFEYFNSPKVNAPEVIDYKYFTGMTGAKIVGDVLILPITSFSPGVGHMGSKGVSDPIAFVKHHFEGSWKPQSERMI